MQESGAIGECDELGEGVGPFRSAEKCCVADLLMGYLSPYGGEGAGEADRARGEHFGEMAGGQCC